MIFPYIYSCSFPNILAFKPIGYIVESWDVVSMLIFEFVVCLYMGLSHVASSLVLHVEECVIVLKYRVGKKAQFQCVRPFHFLWVFCGFGSRLDLDPYFANPI